MMSTTAIYQNRLWLHILFDVIALLLLTAFYYLIFIEKIGETKVIREVVLVMCLLATIQFFYLVSRFFSTISKTIWWLLIIGLMNLVIVGFMLMGYLFLLFLLSGGIGTAVIN